MLARALHLNHVPRINFGLRATWYGTVRYYRYYCFRMDDVGTTSGLFFVLLRLSQSHTNDITVPYQYRTVLRQWVRVWLIALPVRTVRYTGRFGILRELYLSRYGSHALVLPLDLLNNNVFAWWYTGTSSLLVVVKREQSLFWWVVTLVVTL